jgi:glutamyl-tRNA reductase
MVKQWGLEDDAKLKELFRRGPRNGGISTKDLNAKAIKAINEKYFPEREYLYARGARLPDPAGFIGALLRELKGIDLQLQERRHLYTLREEESIRHLFRVACGLESMVLGEPQILGQVKDASELAARVGGAGPVTERLLDTVLRCAKRARTETGIGRGPVSSAYAGVSLAAKVLGTLGDKRALLVGAGEMSASRR